MSTITTISTSADSAPRIRSTRPRAALRLVASTAAAEQLPFPFEYDVTPGIPAVPPMPSSLRVIGGSDEPTGEPPGQLLDPRLWMARLARACAEVAIGARPPMQLKQHVARPELARLARRGMAFQSHPASRNQRGVSRLRKVRAVRICPVAPGIIEASAVLVGGERAQAIAIRLEAVEGRWLATVVELG